MAPYTPRPSQKAKPFPSSSRHRVVPKRLFGALNLTLTDDKAFADLASELLNEIEKLHNPLDVLRALHDIVRECRAASEKFSPFTSDHEGYAVILEELDEAWDAIKRDDHGDAAQEMVQVGAMALRFLLDRCL